MILIVDESSQSQNNIMNVKNLLELSGLRCAWVDSSKKALGTLDSTKPHCILLNLATCGNAREILDLFKKHASHSSIILISGQANTTEIIEGLAAGADDFICLPCVPEVVVARLKVQLRLRGIQEQLQQTIQKLQEIADRDELTGLFNMRALHHLLDLELLRARRFKRSIAVVMMDLDFFKNANDQHDHLFGSFILKEVGSLIQKNIRQIDFAARFGGDEFLVVLAETGLLGARLFCERMRQLIENYHFKNAGDEMQLSASFGFTVTSDPRNMTDAQSLIRNADHQLYKAKSMGRNCVQGFEILEPIEAAKLKEGEHPRDPTLHT